MQIKTLLSRPAITTEPATPLRDARALMRRRGIRHLPVIDGYRLVGMLAVRDIERADVSSIPEIARHDWAVAVAGLVVADVMARDPLALHPETPVTEAGRLARRRRGGGGEATPPGGAPPRDAGARGGPPRPRPAGGRVRGGRRRRGDRSGQPERPARRAQRPAGASPPHPAPPRAHRPPPGRGHVLAATSLRPGCRRALGEALRVAATTGATVTALHVLPAARPIPGAEAEAMVAIERARRHVADEAMAILREAGRDRDVQCEVAEGPVAREIAQRAEELAADLIVIGTAARRGVLGGLVTTLGDRLARLAPCPVLTIPRNGGRDARR